MKRQLSLPVSTMSQWWVRRPRLLGSERCRHLGVAEHGGPFGEGEVGGDDHRGALVEPADQVEQELATGQREGQIAQLVEYQQVDA